MYRKSFLAHNWKPKYLLNFDKNWNLSHDFSDILSLVLISWYSTIIWDFLCILKYQNYILFRYNIVFISQLQSHIIDILTWNISFQWNKYYSWFIFLRSLEQLLKLGLLNSFIFILINCILSIFNNKSCYFVYNLQFIVKAVHILLLLNIVILQFTLHSGCEAFMQKYIKHFIAQLFKTICLLSNT